MNLRFGPRWILVADTRPNSPLVGALFMDGHNITHRTAIDHGRDLPEIVVLPEDPGPVEFYYAGRGMSLGRTQFALKRPDGTFTKGLDTACIMVDSLDDLRERIARWDPVARVFTPVAPPTKGRAIG